MGDNKEDELLAKTIMLIGTEHEHLSFKDVFEISDTIINVAAKGKELKDDK